MSGAAVTDLLTIPEPLLQIAKWGAGEGLKAIFKAQAEEAAASLQKQMAKGRPWRIADDKAAMMMLRYHRAWMEGTARRNLDLLAEALVAGAASPGFEADEFRRIADPLATLSRQEIVVLATFVRVYRLQEPGGFPEDPDGTSWSGIRDQLLETGLFRERWEVEAVASGLSRTGWVLPGSAWGGMVYVATPLLARLAKLISLPDAEARARAEGE